MSTFDDDETELEFFEEPETLEAPSRPRRRIRPPRPGGPGRPSPPPGAVALARLAGFVALAIAVVIGFVFWVGSCQGQSKHDEYSSYMNDLRPLAQNSADTGTAFVNTLGSKKLTVTGLESKLEQWSKQQQQYYDDALRLRPPGPLQAVHQQALATFQLRAIGLTGLANALAQAGSRAAADVAASLATQAQTLSASDVVWANLFHLQATETLARLGIKGVIAPPSQIIRNPEVITADSFESVYTRINSTKSNGKVTGLHGSELVGVDAVSGSSTKQLSPSTPTTVNVASNLAFKVTFTDAGNFQETQVPVTLTVSLFGKPVLTKRQVVQSIDSKATTSVSFANLDLPNSAFGATARVKVEIGKVPGEKNLDNNSASYQVFFSLSGG